jgi:predicted  nucleic acid-binding Zn-ribbon protein
MLFIVPLAYIGASYYNGEDPVALIKDKLGIEENTTQTVEQEVKYDDETYDFRQEIETLKERIQELEDENAELREKVRRLEMDQQTES